MPRPDEGLIHTWLDGELEAAEAARVEKLVAEDAEWAAAAAEARGLVAASSRILGALDVVAGDVIPLGGKAAPEFGRTSVAAPRAARRRMIPTWMKVAAGVVFVAGIGYLGKDGIGISAPAPEPAVIAAETEPNAGAANAFRAESTTNAAADVAARGGAGAVAELGREATTAPSASAPTSVPPVVVERERSVTARALETARAVDDARRDAGARDMTRPAETLAEAAPSRKTAFDSLPRIGVAGGVAAALASSSARAAGADSLDAQKRARSEEISDRFRSTQLRLDQVVVTGATEPTSPPPAQRAAPAGAAKSAAPAPAPQAAREVELPIIEGCFRVRTRAPLDTLLINPKILATDGDSLRIEMTRGYAWVRRDATGALVGRVWWQGSRTSNVRADPIDCS